VVAWDAPGYRESAPLDVRWPDAGDYAEALLGLFDALNMPRCLLVGHSLGALIAARFALRWPARVAALALISPAMGYGAAQGGDLPEKAAARLTALDRLGAAGFAEERAPGLVGDPAARPDVVATVREAMAAVRRPGYDQATRMLASGRLLDDVAAVTVPTAVIVGALDRITPPAGARQVFDALAAAPARQFTEVPAAGHAVCQEEPAAVARALDQLVGQTLDHAAKA